MQPELAVAEIKILTLSGSVVHHVYSTSEMFEEIKPGRLDCDGQDRYCVWLGGGDCKYIGWIYQAGDVAEDEIYGRSEKKKHQVGGVREEDADRQRQMICCGNS